MIGPDWDHATCQWPGCERRKRPGKGARYCAPHQRVADRREQARKREAAKVAKNYSCITKRDGLLDVEEELERYAMNVRSTLRAFGIEKLR